MGLAGLAVGLWVYHNRDETPPHGEPGPPLRPAHETTPATELQGLGYLPADTNIAFAVQPGPFLAYATRTKQDPREVMVRAGLPGKVFNTVMELGLTLPQIDHIAGGTYLGNGNFELRFTLALVSPSATRR